MSTTTPKTSPAKSWPGKKGKPEISIEWLDVTIDIKVCGPDIPDENRGFVRLFPELDTKLLSKDQIDMNRLLFRKERKKLQTFEYKLVPNKPTKEVSTKVLPKLTCDHCGKSFSRRSTLEQHIASHDQHNTSWEDVQDAALQDLEKAIVFEKSGGGANLYKSVTDNVEDLDLSRDEEEEEIPAPHDTDTKEFRCPTCSKVFNKNSNLQKHKKIHTGIKPYACDICGWRFLQNYNLKKHMMSHALDRPNKCVDCLASFPNAASLKDHVERYHDQEELEFLESDLNAPPPQLIRCPFPKCGRKFAAKPHLDRHMPVHNNMAKPYECDVCGWKFHLLHNMERHKATHEKGKKAKVPPHKRMKRKFKKKKKKAAAAPEDATKNTKDSTDVKETTTKVETNAKIKEFSNEFSDEDEVLKDDHQSDDDELPSDLDEDELDDAQLDTSNEAIEETDDLCTTKDEEDAEQPKDDTNEDIESSPTPHSNMDSKEETRSSPL